MEWAFEGPNLETEIWQGYIDGSELFPLGHGSYQAMSRVVISTFVKKWYPRTNTFRMSFGEITIMLDDVSTLLSIPMVENTVFYNLLAHEAWTLVARALKVIEVEATKELESALGQSIRMEWLRSKFQGRVGDNCGHEAIR